MGAFNSALSTAVSEDVFGISPSDSTTVTDGTTPRAFVRQIFITTGGTLKYTSTSGVTNTITVPSAFTLSCAIVKVFATGTTATGMLGYV